MSSMSATNDHPLLYVSISISVVLVEFIAETYTVDEGRGTVEVCLRKDGVTEQDISVTISAQETLPPSAVGMRYFCTFLDELLTYKILLSAFVQEVLILNKFQGRSPFNLEITQPAQPLQWWMIVWLLREWSSSL